MFKDLIQKWWPHQPDQAVWQPRMQRFYATSEAYHAMTAAEKEPDHPQVRLLMALLHPGGTYAEFGCGGGVVCSEVGRVAHVKGFDASPLAVDRARATCGGG